MLTAGSRTEPERQTFVRNDADLKMHQIGEMLPMGEIAAGYRFGRIVHGGGGDTGRLQPLRRLMFVLTTAPGSNDTSS